MKKKIAWLVVSCLMVLSLVLASCAPAVTEERKGITVKEEKEKVVTKEGKEEKEAVSLGPEVPKYGGTIIIGIGGGRQHGGWDEALGAWIHRAHALNLIMEDLIEGDWAKGPAGTGEAGFAISMFPPSHLARGALAESWEMPDSDTLIIHIRQGIYYHDKPPVNGREMTAEDVVFSVKRNWQSTKWRAARWGQYWEEYFESIEATDKWTIVAKFKPGKLMLAFETLMGETKTYAPEMIEKYGDVSDWKNSVGTGPYMLVDHVSGSSFEFKKHPNYWDKDPVGPGKGNQLPYLDGVKWLVMPDTSTRLAALRVGKIDWLGGKYEPVEWEDAELLIERKPDLQYLRYDFARVDAIYFNNGREPFTDKRVRQALLLAVNDQELADTYYGGHATLFAFPIPTIPEFADMYIPLEELPKATQELYEYHPDKAKQLLAEAGYPDGFKTSIALLTTDVDLVSMIQAYWLKIGVELELKVKEPAVYASIQDSGEYDMMIHPATTSMPFKFTRITPRTFTNVYDQIIEDAKTFNAENYFNEPERRKLTKELTPYIAENAWLLAMPQVFKYTFWWPWVQNYHGEYQVGFWKYQNFVKWIWYDPELKKAMGY